MKQKNTFCNASKDVTKIDYSRVIKTFEYQDYFCAGYRNGWLEFFYAGQFAGSVRTLPRFFEGISIDWMQGNFSPAR